MSPSKLTVSPTQPYSRPTITSRPLTPIQLANRSAYMRDSTLHTFHPSHASLGPHQRACPACSQLQHRLQPATHSSKTTFATLRIIAIVPSTALMYLLNLRLESRTCVATPSCRPSVAWLCRMLGSNGELRRRFVRD